MGGGGRGPVAPLDYIQGACQLHLQAQVSNPSSLQAIQRFLSGGGSGSATPSSDAEAKWWRGSLSLAPNCFFGYLVKQQKMDKWMTMMKKIGMRHLPPRNHLMGEPWIIGIHQCFINQYQCSSSGGLDNN
ncbi:hypothetical protein QTG54_001367 [Skeletonema marinoi]|uniref:Uncharacterized protein n=1 Tax=Skeletonema marinoi TaxID=267567 RepID=A0AAD9DII4_9STRA|nr:hypothetical protein QTG54_001367 [Skeletonema marinoi]